jgi:diadenylate cyclase
LFALLDVFFFLFLRRKNPIIMMLVFEVFFLLTYCLDVTPLNWVFLIVWAIVVICVAITNANDLRLVFANRFKGKAMNLFTKKSSRGESLFDREAMYQTIAVAVNWFSRTKTGALITFEKTDNLDSYIATGVKVNAPVSAELLETIFYEGTRLHDGAVIIRNNEIVSAACLYQPSTRPVTGKMGLRHRAAMGISADTDSVTVVVSEETGRISIAYDGELQTINTCDFLRVFSEYMALTKTEETE